MKIDLYDRLIDVKLIREDGSSVTIKTPRTGPKPSITLSGSFTANVIYDAELKMTNFYTPADLLTPTGGSAYKWIEITCGYKSGMMTPITGQIWVAYQDKPSPDGVTTFQFFTGFADAWMTQVVSSSEEAGVPLNDALRRVCSQLKVGKDTVTLKTEVYDSLLLTAPIKEDTNLSDFCIRLGRAYGVSILPEGKQLRVTYSGLAENSLAPVHELLFYNDVKKTAATLTVTAPFDPSVRPSDYIKIEPKYMSSDLSGMFATFGSDFRVLKESFSFGTTDGGNRMILTTVGSPKVHTDVTTPTRNLLPGAFFPT